VLCAIGQVVTASFRVSSVPLTDLEASRIRLGNKGQQIAFFSLDDVASLPPTTNLSTQLNDYRDVFVSAITGL
jgi:hypothetical protein